jgi:AcrR family transcriptional regulator
MPGAVPSSAIGRSLPQRRDSVETRAALIAAVGRQVGGQHEPPTSLVEAARIARVSTATAYRHFASLDELVLAHVMQLPERAVENFDRRLRRLTRSEHSPTAVERFSLWNRCWVDSCVEFGPSAVALRSAEGFLARRARREPSVFFVCANVEPLLASLGGTADPLSLLVMWNAMSDPREVLDLRATRRWSAARIATFVTNTVVACAQHPDKRLAGTPPGV